MKPEGAQLEENAKSGSTISRRRLAMFRSFYHRDFSIFWAGNFLSNTGTWMQNIALGWLILIITNSPFLLGLNGFLAQIPSLVFSLPGGTIADRLNRRKLMLSTQTIMMLLALFPHALHLPHERLFAARAFQAQIKDLTAEQRHGQPNIGDPARDPHVDGHRQAQGEGQSA